MAEVFVEGADVGGAGGGEGSAGGVGEEGGEVVVGSGWGEEWEWGWGGSWVGGGGGVGLLAEELARDLLDGREV